MVARSGVWIAADFGLTHQSINRYREAIGCTIVQPGDLNLSQDQRVALETEILKRERLGKDGKVQSVTCRVGAWGCGNPKGRCAR